MGFLPVIFSQEKGTGVKIRRNSSSFPSEGIGWMYAVIDCQHEGTARMKASVHGGMTASRPCFLGFETKQPMKAQNRSWLMGCRGVYGKMADVNRWAFTCRFAVRNQLNYL